MEKFYMVGFDGTGNSYYFYSKENAIKFIEESYNDDFTSTFKGMIKDDEVYDNDMKTLKQDGYIDDYAWIEECYFEDG